VMPVCLITGATGAVGPSVVEAFHARGYHVRTLSRHAPAEGLLPQGVTPFTGEITDAGTVERATREADIVVHLASLLHIASPGAAMRREYERVNIGGTSTVVAVAQGAGVRRVVVASTIAVYGYQGGVLLDEESPVQPDTLYGETKLAAERLALAARRSDGAPLCTVLRSAAVYGPRVKGNYRRLVDALARHRFVPIGSGLTRRTVVFDCDLASALVLASEHSAAAGRVFNVSDGQPHALSEIIEAICRALERRPPRVHVPAGAVRAAAALADGALHLAGRKPIVRALVDKYLEDAAVDARRIQRELGFAPHVTLQDGWQRTVCALRGALPAG
jgi:nucleoside-diphosphate-sugar epimerase